MLRRVAEALHSRVRVVFEPEKKSTGMRVAEEGAAYGVKSTMPGGNESEAGQTAGTDLSAAHRGLPVGIRGWIG